MNNGPERTSIAGERDDGLPMGPVLEPGLESALESALGQALRHEDPPPGFADRLIARVVAGEYPRTVIPVAPPVDKSKVLHWPPSRIWTGGAIAAALLLGLFEGEVALKHFREQQRRIAEATAQFQTTERVTVHALAQAREQLQRAGVPLTLD